MKPWLRVSSRFMWTVLILVAVGWIVWRVDYVHRTSNDEIARILEVSLSTSKSEASAWAGAQRDRVAMAAQLTKGRDLATPDAQRDLRALLDAMVDRQGGAKLPLSPYVLRI